MRHRPRVILLIESSRAYGRGCLQGIASYVRERGPWSCMHLERALVDEIPPWLARLPADGILARIDGPVMAHFIERRGLPTVDLRGRYALSGVATFDTDAATTAQLAVEHFCDRGLRNLAFCGFAGLDFSDRRRDAWRRCLGRERLEGQVYEASDTTGGAATVTTEAAGSRRLQQLAAWPKRLPKPVGFLACNDARGRQVLDACAAAGIAVPEEVAVVGVDDDAVLCELSDPPLSSVRPDTMRIGYEGAALLDRMMRNHRHAPRRPRLIPPKTLVVRRSSDVSSVQDPIVSTALKIIWRDADQGLNVERLLDQMTVSRATLERRFERILGRSPKDEILRLRLARVRDLLLDTPGSLTTIAELTGFNTAAHLGVTFKKHMAMTPGEFREAHQKRRRGG